jgi:hypothetical protein
VSQILASRYTITKGKVAAIVRPVSASLSARYKKVVLIPNRSSKEFNICVVAGELSPP